MARTFEELKAAAIEKEMESIINTLRKKVRGRLQAKADAALANPNFDAKLQEAVDRSLERELKSFGRDSYIEENLSKDNQKVYRDKVQKAIMSVFK